MDHSNQTPTSILRPSQTYTEALYKYAQRKNIALHLIQTGVFTVLKLLFNGR